MYEGKYFFISNVRIISGGEESVVSQILDYSIKDEAEIKFHDEVSYALKLGTLVLAHFEVKNEYGVVVDKLERTIDRTSELEPNAE